MTEKKDVKVKMQSNKEIDKKSTEKDETIELLKKQLDEMKKQMEQIKDSVPASVSPVVVDREVKIGTYMIQGIGFTSTDKTISISISYDNPQILQASEISKLFRQYSIKKLFEDGVCYFLDENDYKSFGILNHIDLSDKALKDILSKDISSIVTEMNQLTSNKQDSTISNCMIYRICNMIRKNILGTIDFYKRKELEDYFGLPFERGIKVLDDLDNLGRIKV